LSLVVDSSVDEPERRSGTCYLAGTLSNQSERFLRTVPALIYIGGDDDYELTTPSVLFTYSQ